MADSITGTRSRRYAVQGSTRTASTSAITATTARSELYVDITRGRDSNQLYGTRVTGDGDSEAHLPRLDGELIPTLHRHLARGTVRTALALDPDALAVSRARRGRNLLGLLAARQRGETGPIDQAIRRTTRRSPPPSLQQPSRRVARRAPLPAPLPPPRHTMGSHCR